MKLLGFAHRFAPGHRVRLVLAATDATSYGSRTPDVVTLATGAGLVVPAARRPARGGRSGGGTCPARGRPVGPGSPGPACAPQLPATGPSSLLPAAGSLLLALAAPAPARS